MQAEYIDNIRGFIKVTGDGQVRFFLTKSF
jgi:hypothetical protein